MFKIEISNLTFNAIIGILDFERETEQKVVLTCKIEYPYTNEKFIDYAKICELLETDIKTSKYFLIEKALENLEKILVKKYPQIKTLTLKISKPQILENCEVGVEIFRNY